MKSYQFKLAKTPAEISAYFALRHAIFVEEQQLFQSHDIDDIDQIAYPIIAVCEGDRSLHPVNISADTVADPIVGVVRIYEPKPGFWYGGRLGTHPKYRKGWQIGKGLIDKAVTTANTWGCQQFLATVQLQNVRFFQRLHWQSLQEIVICDRPHHLMQADLNFYPASTEPRPPLAFHAKEVS